ncbi:MAG: terminase [Alphaproteobacteria bacterium]|nr:terminase [Alphaproteobacteria bacterium]
MTPATIDRLRSRRWRLDNLYQVRDAYGRRVQFRMNRVQRRLFENRHNLNLVLKARQLGMTTFIQLLMLDTCLFKPNMTAGTVAHTLHDAETIFRDKIRFPYEHLPSEIRRATPAVTDSARELAFANGSRLRVGTSLRSGTYQYLHISEHGAICARYPDKAAEIRAGALNTVHPGQTIYIESTAEGREGDFHDFCQAAMRRAAEGQPETALDFRFHFFPWWENPGYVLPPAGVRIGAGLEAYFERLDAEGIVLSPGQKAWYARKSEQQGDRMMREFPATPEEAFAASNEGAYFRREMARVRAEGRICVVPHEPGLPVNTFWDLGINDNCVVWFHQRAGREDRFIDYLETSGDGLPEIVRALRAKPYTYATHCLPHDVEVRELGTGLSRRRMLEDLGVRPVRTVPRTADIGADIQAARNALARCWFDAARCEAGLRHLDGYRREWDGRAGVWKDRPRHDAASHAADAFRMFAVGFRPEVDAARFPETVGMDWDPLSGGQTDRRQ